MSVVSLITHNYSVFHKALIFLMRLAWKSRIRLPYLIMIGFMALDIRLTFEIVINVEHPPVENGFNQSGSSSDSEDSDDLKMKEAPSYFLEVSNKSFSKCLALKGLKISKPFSQVSNGLEKLRGSQTDK